MMESIYKNLVNSKITISIKLTKNNPLYLHLKIHRQYLWSQKFEFVVTIKTFKKARSSNAWIFKDRN
jgi:hypothetical protein